MNDFMQKVSLLFVDKEHRIGELLVDAIIKESHELRAEISEHPTEKGESFVDHIANCPTTIQIEGIISNTPMSLIGKTLVTSLSNFIEDKSNDIAEQAFKTLENIFAKRRPISICTSLKDYDNMVLESLSVERGGGLSECLHFHLSAKQVAIVEQKTIVLPKPKPQRAKPKQNLGKQETKAKVINNDKQTALKALISWAST